MLIITFELDLIVTFGLDLILAFKSIVVIKAAEQTEPREIGSCYATMSP